MNKLFATLAGHDIGRVLIMGVVLTALYWGILYDDGSAQEANIAQNQILLTEEEAKKADTESTLKQVKEMQERIGQLSEKYQEISRKLPANLFSIDINKAIDDFAKKSGVRIKQKRPIDNRIAGVIEEVPVEITLEGSYDQLTQFAYVVSTAEKMARVINLNIATSETAGKILKLEGQVVGYKMAPEVKKPKVEEPQ